MCERGGAVPASSAQMQAQSYEGERAQSQSLAHGCALALGPCVAPQRLIHGLCAIFASNSRFMRLFQAALDTCLDSPFFESLSVHGLHFTVYAPSR